MPSRNRTLLNRLLVAFGSVAMCPADEIQNRYLTIDFFGANFRLSWASLGNTKKKTRERERENHRSTATCSLQCSSSMQTIQLTRE
uniref:Putative secreted protein n=1 Tax=Anopheles darlingi TaxID=43151 RepID=A0A2M4DN55_ANODA